LCAIAAKRLGGWPAAIAAAVLILGNRAALVTASELEPETLIFVLIGGAIAALPRWPWLAGLLVGLAAVARPVALGTIVLLTIWLFFRSKRVAAIFAGAAIVPLAAIVIINLALTGSAIIMQPGTQFYEGNNPLATGCAGVMPRIVAEMNASSPEPDFLHVAYRIVAARATGTPIDAGRANRYWSAKSFAWMRIAPLDALELFAWKGLLSIHNYDIYDLETTKKKSDELARWPALPFGVVVTLAIAALVLARKNRRELLPLVLFTLATIAALVLFNVSSRQRNALLPPAAVLAGVAVAEIVALARAKNERALLAFGAVAIGAMILGIEGPPQREDRHNWESVLQSNALRRAAIAARDRGDPVHAAQFAAAASIAAIDQPPLVSARTLRSYVLAVAPRETDPARRFDLAVALIKADAYAEADAILATLTDYRPRRENRAVSSVAYYRAICALAMHRSVDVAAARAEAPGDPDVLALAGDRRTLDALHDPFTRNRALAAARDLRQRGQWQ
ncbi:MAG TPA: hypothetical protein VN181_08090, partial [Thermoanaerobaculia bacterium]|nr:hypothetical protein [Thermoanaerobaculia bacterium]